MKSHSTIGHRCIHEITSVIEKELKKTKISGLSIALVDDEGTIWSEGFGYTNFSNKERVTANTLFSLQSMNKCFTATTFLILASRGLINLDDSIRKYYPEFTVNTIFGDPEEEIEKITFRRMLSHWSGFTHEAPLGNNYDTTPHTFTDHIRSISESWLRSPVGSEHAYSNIGIDLTGYVMGLIQNRSYEEVMKEELLSPLGIVDATFNVDDALKQSFARGHSGLHQTPAYQVPMIPAGGFYASANDVAKIVSFHLRRGKINGMQIIDSDLFDEMYKPQFSESREFGYGLGVYSFWTIKGAKSFAHGGGGYGYSTLAQWIPEHKIGTVILTNDTKHSLPGRIMQKILEIACDFKSEPDTIPVEENALRKLEGTYIAYRQPLINIVFENGKLYFYQTDGTEMPLFSQDSTNFITRNGSKCRFTLNEEGLPVSMAIETPTAEINAKYNDGPCDRTGPNVKEWQEALGVYLYRADGRDYYLGVTVNNGYLYLFEDDWLKLHHSNDNLYFTVDGESVLIGIDSLLYKNIPASKVELNLDQLIGKIASDEVKYDRYRGAASALIPILDTVFGFEDALNFIERLTGIDSEFKVNYTQFGKRLYALGRLEESSRIFTELHQLDVDNEDAEEMLRIIELRKS